MHARGLQEPEKRNIYDSQRQDYEAGQNGEVQKERRPRSDRRTVDAIETSSLEARQLLGIFWPVSRWEKDKGSNVSKAEARWSRTASYTILFLCNIRLCI